MSATELRECCKCGSVHAMSDREERLERDRMTRTLICRHCKGDTTYQAKPGSVVRGPRKKPYVEIASLRAELAALKTQAAYDSEALQRMQNVGAELEAMKEKLAEAATELTKAKQRGDWLDKERDYWIKEYYTEEDQHFQAIAQRDAATAEAERLRKAIQPLMPLLKGICMSSYRGKDHMKEYTEVEAALNPGGAV